VLKVVDGDLYHLGTNAGTLSYLITRNQFTLCEEIFLESAIIPKNEIGIRQAVSQLSLTGEQGLIRCDCLKKCKKIDLSVNPKMYCAIQDVTLAKPVQTNNLLYVLL